jgi:hypothetical protein
MTGGYPALPKKHRMDQRFLRTKLNGARRTMVQIGLKNRRPLEDAHLVGCVG